MKPIAFVIPWFGADQKGGAEQLSWQVTTRLAQRGHAVEVLTTCCRSFLENWSSNHLPAGIQEQQGVMIRRFAVDHRRKFVFDRVNASMLALSADKLRPGVAPVSAKQAASFVSNNINSTALQRYLRQHGDNYQAFVFIPYLYGPILQGLPLVASRAFLQPALHDEVYAYLPQVEAIFHLARGVLFNSEGEALLARRLYGPAIATKGIVVGCGVEIAAANSDEVAPPPGLAAGHRHYVLYLGRRDASKNTDFLVQCYAAFRQSRPGSRLQLVLAGPGHQTYSGSGVLDLGLVSEAQKLWLLSNCRALLNPSRNESYSRVMMEAWRSYRPVAVHRDCLATATAVVAAQGGWLAASGDEWVAVMERIDQDDGNEITALAANGHAYAGKYSDWNQVIDRYERVLELRPPHSSQLRNRSHHRSQLAAIHQLLPCLVEGDAISNQTLAIQDYLRSQGYHSQIFAVQHVAPGLAMRAKIYRSGNIPANAGLIFHHSIGCRCSQYAHQHPGPKAMIYHNLTPPQYFAAYNPHLERLLIQGRQELHQLASSFSVAVGDSSYNVADLVAAGYPQPWVLPIMITPSRWDIAADPEWMAALQDGRRNILFVGRIAPNKCQLDLLDAFARYCNLQPHSRLILAGGGKDAYYRDLKRRISRYGLPAKVRLTGHINEAQLAACYRSADLFVSLSEHEGFGVPLIEAMWFDIPILAYKSAAVPETLGMAAFLATDKRDPVKLAVLMEMLLEDKHLRQSIIAAQRCRRCDFLPKKIEPQLARLVTAIENLGPQLSAI